MTKQDLYGENQALRRAFTPPDEDDDDDDEDEKKEKNEDGEEDEEDDEDGLQV